MFDTLPGLVPTGGAVAMLGAVVWMIFTGRLIPGQTHQRIVADKDERIAKLESAYDKVAAQRDEMMELARTTVAIVQALPRVKDPTA